jgi:hypothetical protein
MEINEVHLLTNSAVVLVHGVDGIVIWICACMRRPGKVYISWFMSLCCRVHTLAVPIAQDLNALYAGADTGAITSIIAKLAVEKSLHGKLEVPPGSAPSCVPCPRVQLDVVV